MEVINTTIAIDGTKRAILPTTLVIKANATAIVIPIKYAPILVQV